MLTSRTGNFKDSNFIMGCLLEGARHGSFAIELESPDSVQCLKSEINMILTRNLTAQGIPAQTLVYYEGDKRVGFAIVTDLEEGRLALELYAIAVAARYRGKGYGSQILNDVLLRFDYSSFFARCSPISATMQQMLERRSFITIDTNELGYSIMVRHWSTELYQAPMSLTT